MKGKYFLDTNIFVYSFDLSSPIKKKRSQELINTALLESKGVISYQVIQEFLSVSTRKFTVPLTIDSLKIYLDQVLLPLCELYSSADLYRIALEVRANTGYAFYDALMVAASIKTSCNILYSEDLQHGHVIGKVKIINPFT